MSSGVRWTEDYSDPQSDVFRIAHIMARGASFAAFPATLTREHAPGTFNRYNSTDTLVLGMLLERVTGTRIANYMQNRLWGPLGATSEAYWLTDEQGLAMSFGGLNATARRLCPDRRIIPKWWADGAGGRSCQQHGFGHRSTRNPRT